MHAIHLRREDAIRPARSSSAKLILLSRSSHPLVDNARIYANELSVGSALAHVSSAIPRSELYITTKYDAINGTDVRTEFEASLKDLGVDYVDLYLVHFPAAMEAGGGYSKVWTAMEKLKKEGRARSVSRTLSGTNEDSEDEAGC